MGLVACQACGNTLSSAAKVCARCGRAMGPPLLLTRVTAAMGGNVYNVIGLGVFVFALCVVAGVWLSRPAPAPPAAAVVPAGPDPNSVRAVTEAKMSGAARVWDAFEKLPKEQRTRALWNDALTESTAHANGLDSYNMPIFERVNAARARKNAAAIINPEAVAKGENFDVLVPSPYPEKCGVWAEQWAREVEALRALGFRRIHCDGVSFVSKLTGDIVQEGGREWAVGDP